MPVFALVCRQPRSSNQRHQYPESLPPCPGCPILHSNCAVSSGDKGARFGKAGFLNFQAMLSPEGFGP
jgi:hypothetical protein